MMSHANGKNVYLCNLETLTHLYHAGRPARKVTAVACN